MDNLKDLRRFFLIALITSLLIFAASSILIFLFGNFTQIEIRILQTMASISAASLLGILFSKFKTDYVRILGISIIGIMFLITIGTIWKVFGWETFAKGLGISLILIALLAQAPWVLRKQIDKTLRSVGIATFISASIIALMVIQIILNFVDFNDTYFRFLGVFGVLYLLGLILNPILKKLLH